MYIGLNLGLNNSVYVGKAIGLINVDVGIFSSLNAGLDIGLGVGTVIGWMLA